MAALNTVRQPYKYTDDATEIYLGGSDIRKVMSDSKDELAW